LIRFSLELQGQRKRCAATTLGLSSDHGVQNFLQGRENHERCS
jgi:hypothetical protein